MSRLQRTAGVCENCGEPAYAHEKERVTHQDGTYSYEYYCPNEGDE